MSQAPKFNVTVIDGDVAAELRSLWSWLVPNSFRGEITLVDRAPVSGELGFGPEAILVALAPGGVVAGLVTALISWLRLRLSDIDVKLTTADGRSVEISASRVRRLDSDGIAAMVEQVSRSLDHMQQPAAPTVRGRRRR